jgi:rhodanese-related sulfurtransferase
VAQLLLENGFKQVRALKGGWDAWVKAAGPVEPKQQAEK